MRQTPWVFIQALLLFSHVISHFHSFLMSLAATIRESMEEKVPKVLPICSDEFSNLKTNIKICTYHLIMLKATKIKKIKWLAHVAHVGGMNITFLQKTLNKIHLLWNLAVDKSVTVKWGCAHITVPVLTSFNNVVFIVLTI